MNNVQVKENLGQEIEEELEQIREDMFLRLDKALKLMKGKSILLDTFKGLMVDIYFPEFDYNCCPNCKDQLLLNFKDEDESILGATVKLDDIYDIEIIDNIDSEETEYYCECVRIELFNKQSIRLELQ